LLRWRLFTTLILVTLALLVVAVSVRVVQGYSELVSCSNGVYLFVEDNGYVTVYAVLGIDEDEAMQIALECLRAIEHLLLMQKTPMLQPIGSYAQSLEWRLEQVEEAVNLVASASSQMVLQEMSRRGTIATTVTHHATRYSVSPTMSTLLVILSVLLGYLLSRHMLERFLGGHKSV